MIRFVRPAEPPDFDAQVRQPGRAWLATHPPPGRPRDLWSPFKPHLADAFAQLCAYSAMYEPVGTIDHFLGCHRHRELAYEWSNYRYASAWINSAKRRADDDVLDPFEVEDGWFEILLPSLQLVATAQIPRALRAKAEATLARLHLRDDERVLRQRREWYRMFQKGELSLAGLETKAPLIARAVRRKAGSAVATPP